MLTTHFRFALGGSPYSIGIFLGDVPASDILNFGRHPTAVSTVYNFSSSTEGRGIDESGCDNCKDQAAQAYLACGQVILTDYLIQQIYLGEELGGLTLTTLDPEEVTTYLRKNLHWRIVDVSVRSLYTVTLYNLGSLTDLCAQ